MRHGRKVKKLSRTKSHREAMQANQLKTLLQYGKIETTQAKAKALKPFVDKFLSKVAQKEARELERFVEMTFGDNKFLHIIDKVKSQLSGESTGYTRLFKLENRKGDNSKMALLKMVYKDDTKKDK